MIRFDAHGLSPSENIVRNGVEGIRLKRRKARSDEPERVEDLASRKKDGGGSLWRALRFTVPGAAVALCRKENARLDRAAERKGNMIAREGGIKAGEIEIDYVPAGHDVGIHLPHDGDKQAEKSRFVRHDGNLGIALQRSVPGAGKKERATAGKT